MKNFFRLTLKLGSSVAGFFGRFLGAEGHHTKVVQLGPIYSWLRNLVHKIWVLHPNEIPIIKWNFTKQGLLQLILVTLLTVTAFSLISLFVPQFEILPVIGGSCAICYFFLVKTTVSRFILLLSFGLSSLAMMSLLLKMSITGILLCFIFLGLLLLVFPLQYGFATILLIRSFLFPPASEWRFALPIIITVLSIYFFFEKEEDIDKLRLRRTQLKYVLWILLFFFVKGDFLSAYIHKSPLVFLILLGGISAIFFFSFATSDLGQLLSFGVFFISSLVIGGSILQPQGAEHFNCFFIIFHILILSFLCLRASIQKEPFHFVVNEAKQKQRLIYFILLKVFFIDIESGQEPLWLIHTIDNLIFQLGFISLLVFLLKDESTPFFRMSEKSQKEK